MDWDAGGYERIAEGLRPAAGAVVELAAPAAGERVIDVGCGTGTAALLAAERGARVTGVDPAERLLALARSDARARGLQAVFIRGGAEALPMPDRAAEVVLSAFGVIFAADARAAAAEMARVCTTGGRLVLSAWLPTGALAEVARARSEALRSVTGRRAGASAGAPAGAPPFDWHRRDALEALLAPHGFELRCSERALAFGAPSAAAFLDAEIREHPAWVAARAALARRGGIASVRERALEILEAANERPPAFQVTSRYVLVSARRAGPPA